MTIAGGKRFRGNVVVDLETYNYSFKDLSTKELLELRPRATAIQHLISEEKVQEFYKELNSREHIRTKAQAKAERKARAHAKKHR